MTKTATEAVIRAFLLEEVLYDRRIEDLAPTENLIDNGMLNSLGILKTVAFCEEHFGIAIPDDLVLPENMESVRAIATLIEALRRPG